MTSVLFICKKNAGKSQMAAALTRTHAAQLGVEIHVFSAGTQPGESPNDLSIQSLAEVAASHLVDSPKPVDPQLLACVDHVVVLGREAQVDMPDNARGTFERWDTDEPSERGIEGAERMRLIRNDIDRRVRVLLTDVSR